MRLSIASMVLLLGFAATVGAIIRKHIGIPEEPALDVEARAAFNSSTFQQLIDHSNPSLGTFSQFFYYSDEFWKGPGSPVVFFTPGEVAAEAYSTYLTNSRLTGMIAQAIGGAVIVMEHRYWGRSSPYEELTVKNLQHLTLANSIADTVYFAKNAYLPFDPTNSSNAQHAPWVFSGGSYSGALSAWTASVAPGTFWAYHATSAVVEAIFDFWQYFYPVQEGMPANCSKDISHVIDYMDTVLLRGRQEDIKELKTMFGLEAVEHNGDFMDVLANGPWLWQSNTPTSGYSKFYQFCDAVEGVVAGQNNTIGENGVGPKKALAGYASWVKSFVTPGYCASTGYNFGPNDLGCLDSYNASNPYYTDLSVGNVADRQWIWFLCNEPFAWWQDGAPLGKPTIVSRLQNAHYWQRQCDLYFPPEGEYTYGSNRGLTVGHVNDYTKGWYFTKTERLIWTNGEFDPWRPATVSSTFRPGGPLQSTNSVPLQIIPRGIHCSDLHAGYAVGNPGVQKVIDTEIAQLKTWVEEWYRK